MGGQGVLKKWSIYYIYWVSGYIQRYGSLNLWQKIDWGSSHGVLSSVIFLPSVSELYIVVYSPPRPKRYIIYIMFSFAQQNGFNCTETNSLGCRFLVTRWVHLAEDIYTTCQFFGLLRKQGRVYINCSFNSILIVI